MIFKRKTSHKLTKHGEVTSGSRGGSRTPTTYKMQLYVALCGSMWQHGSASAHYSDNIKNFIHLPIH